MKRREIHIDAVYDIECGKWTDFVCGGYLSSDGDFHLFSDHISAPTQLNSEAMASHILSSGGTTWAHYGGKYDHKWLIDIAARRGYSVNISAAGSRIVAAQCGHLALRDSWAVVPVSLKDFTEGLGIHKEELGLPCICESNESCGGYCSISKQMPKALYDRLTEYLYADCKSLYDALIAVQEFAREYDIDLGATVGSASWRTLQRWLGVMNADMDANEHTFCRRAYYGGRTQLYIPGYLENVHEYDVCSMYSWAMRDNPMPVGRRRHLLGKDAANAIGQPGIYQCTIFVPEFHLPPLPYRTKKRVAYPTGTVSGTWSMPEIQHALDRGCKLVEVSEAMVWSDTALLFAPYVDRIFALRSKAGKKSPVGQWLKFMLNAPTGKMGSNPDKERYFVNPTQFVKCPGNAPCIFRGERDCGRCCDKHCNRRCGAMAEHSDYIWSQYQYKLDACAKVEWASYLTSNARIELNTQQLSVGNEGRDVVMSDTDSCYALQKRTRKLGSDCGQWEYKGVCSKFYGIAPKTYWFERDGKTESRAKGLRVGKGHRVEVGKIYPSAGVIGLAQGAKIGKLFVPQTQIVEGRQARTGVGDRVLTIDGMTRAPRIEELEE